MNLTRDNAGTITSFNRLYNRLASAGLFVRVNSELGEWDLLPMEGISARDYWSLILINNGVPIRGPDRNRSRSPNHRWHVIQPLHPAHRRRTPSPEYMLEYSPSSSRASSPLYVENDVEIDGFAGDGVGPEHDMERGSIAPPRPVPESPLSPPPFPPPPPPPTPASQVFLPLPAQPVLLPLPAQPVLLPLPAPPVLLPLPAPMPMQAAPQGLNRPRWNLCSVCQDPDAFTNVVFFRCRHMICELCFEGMFAYGDPQRCPQCRTRGLIIRGIIQ